MAEKLLFQGLPSGRGTRGPRFAALIVTFSPGHSAGSGLVLVVSWRRFEGSARSALIPTHRLLLILFCSLHQSSFANHFAFLRFQVGSRGAAGSGSSTYEVGGSRGSGGGGGLQGGEAQARPCW